MSITAANGVQIAKMVKMKWHYKAPVAVVAVVVYTFLP